MQATILQIAGRPPKHSSDISGLQDFQYTLGGTIDAEGILENPNVSLYCLDHARRQAIFAELPPEIDLAQAAFYYQAQFDHAQRLIAVPYAEFHQLADQIPLDASRLILIHNIGRCGSTLLHNAFNEVDGVISFSEPDVFASFVLMRDEDHSNLIRLLQSCWRFVARGAANTTGTAATTCLKFRNQCVDVLDLFAEALPQAKHLFLYRNLVSWVASIYRMSLKRNRHDIMNRDETLQLQAAFYNRPAAAVERFFPPALDTYTWETYRATGWLLMMDRYLELFAQGIQPLALRYEDLSAQPEAVLTALFADCGLPVSAVQAALRAFARDSQANTLLARSDAHTGNTVSLPDDILPQLDLILQLHPVIRQPDFVLPGTLTFD